jgi:hypothetical protein
MLCLIWNSRVVRYVGVVGRFTEDGEGDIEEL